MKKFKQKYILLKGFYLNKSYSRTDLSNCTVVYLNKIKDTYKYVKHEDCLLLNNIIICTSKSFVTSFKNN